LYSILRLPERVLSAIRAALIYYGLESVSIFAALSIDFGLIVEEELHNSSTPFYSSSI
jgi:hypothetical protein